jgi:hypothetical protein
MMSQSYWDLLPSEIRSKVFEYDGTYKEIMNKKVFSELWQKVWILHRDFIDCPYRRVVMDYLLHSWGVYEMKLPYCNYWYKNNYFPDDFHHITSFHYNNTNNTEEHKKVGVVIYSKNNCLFDGWVLNEEAQREKNWEYNRDTVDSIDVYWDTRLGLYVWRKLYW